MFVGYLGQGLSRVKWNNLSHAQDVFPTVWMIVVKSIMSTSIERFDSMKNKLKRIVPSSYPGQNLRLMASDIRRLAKELTSAGQYDHNLTLNILNNFLLAGGESSIAEGFRFPLRGKKTMLESELLKTPFMSSAEADKSMLEKELSYKDICNFAVDEYRRLFDQGEWLPSKNARDSKAPPSGFGINVAQCHPVETPLTNAQVLALIQQQAHQAGGGSQSGPKQGTCHNCGQNWTLEARLSHPQVLWSPQVYSCARSSPSFSPKSSRSWKTAI